MLVKLHDVHVYSKLLLDQLLSRTSTNLLPAALNVRVLASFMTFYDAKPQLVITPVVGKPSTISPITHANVYY